MHRVLRIGTPTPNTRELEKDTQIRKYSILGHPAYNSVRAYSCFNGLVLAYRTVVLGPNADARTVPRESALSCRRPRAHPIVSEGTQLVVRVRLYRGSRRGILSGAGGF